MTTQEDAKKIDQTTVLTKNLYGTQLLYNAKYAHKLLQLGTQILLNVNNVLHKSLYSTTPLLNVVICIVDNYKNGTECSIDVLI